MTTSFSPAIDLWLSLRRIRCPENPLL